MILTENAIKYTIRHLFKVAWNDVLPEVQIDVTENRRSAVATIKGKKIIFAISEHAFINQLLQRSIKVSKTNTADGIYSIPICLDESLPFAEIKTDELHINADIVSLSFVMLSRYEEFVIKERDKHGRFEYKSSIAAKYDFIDFPIVDEYALILQIYLKILFPEENLVVSECKIIPTHDIDDVRRFAGLKKTIRTLLGDVFHYKSPVMFFRSIWQWLISANSPSEDPYIKSIRNLVKISDKFNLKSEFYFMGAKPSRMDNGYDIANSYIVDVLSFIRQHNMIVGFHGGYHTSTNSELFGKEKTRIEHAFGDTIQDGRQHYLRFNIHNSFSVWDECGIQYDSTLGYAEREGFRCGTCHEYHPWDFENDREYRVKERPLIVMDCTLSDYRKLSISKAYKQTVQLYSRCKTVGGNFVILWHNGFATRNVKWTKDVYFKFLNNHCHK